MHTWPRNGVQTEEGMFYSVEGSSNPTGNEKDMAKNSQRAWGLQGISINLQWEKCKTKVSFDLKWTKYLILESGVHMHCITSWTDNEDVI